MFLWASLNVSALTMYRADITKLRFVVSHGAVLYSA